ncbi:cyclic AMP-dependent transcription factor ATF-4 [Crotalus adamanteus]|uniref:Cyclic AMP-dependent transcription factor ATF-4 n=1 Tax=Crotalus adamanteus TaxID=8729 RepID=A0AAW1BCL3_CROAD
MVGAVSQATASAIAESQQRRPRPRHLQASATMAFFKSSHSSFAVIDKDTIYLSRQIDNKQCLVADEGLGLLDDCLEVAKNFSSHGFSSDKAKVGSSNWLDVGNWKNATDSNQEDAFSGMDWMVEKMDLKEFDFDALLGIDLEATISPDELMATLEDTWRRLASYASAGAGGGTMHARCSRAALLGDGPRVPSACPACTLAAGEEAEHARQREKKKKCERESEQTPPLLPLPAGKYR